MTTSDRLNKITAKRAELDAQNNAEQKRKEQLVAKYAADIKALAPRIKELITLCVAMIDNDIPIGKREKDTIGYKEEFITEGINHRLGFFFEWSNGKGSLIGIGIRGGGCCGNDLAVNQYGNMVKNPINHIVGCWTYDRAHFDYCDKCKKFLDGFDEFERKVNEYIDNL